MHTSACRKICLCNNPDRLCMAERDALEDPSIITNNLGADYSHFKTHWLKQYYCFAVYRHCGFGSTVVDVEFARKLYLEYEANKVKKVELTTPWGFFRKQLLEMQANWAENREKVKMQRAEERATAEESRNIYMAEAWWLEIIGMAWKDIRWKQMSESFQLVCFPESMHEYQRVMEHNNIRHPFEIWKLRNQHKFTGLIELKRYIWERSGKPTTDKHRGANTYTYGTKWLIEECRSLIKLWPTGRVNPQIYADADQFYETVKETLYTDPWSTVLSRDLGLDYTESATECKYRYELNRLIHPFHMWVNDEGFDLDNNPVDRVILFWLAGSPRYMDYLDGIIKIIRKIGIPFIPHLPQFQTEEEQSMAKATEERKSDVEVAKGDDGWYMYWEGKKLPIKLGNLPKRNAVYTEPFYNFVNSVAKVGISLGDSNYSIEVNESFEITWIDGTGMTEVTGLMVPQDHPFFDMVRVEVPASSLFNG